MHLKLFACILNYAWLVTQASQKKIKKSGLLGFWKVKAIQLMVCHKGRTAVPNAASRHHFDALS